MVKRILRKYKYPPDLQDAAAALVLLQAQRGHGPDRRGVADDATAALVLLQAQALGERWTA